MANKNNIEQKATSAVIDDLANVNKLQPFIANNDKEPSWDGNVYLYSDKNQKKQNLVGRIPVQVKGKVVKNLSVDKISFSVLKSDLKNYANDKGVIFFVVYIDKCNLNQKKIFYKTLLPVELKVLLDKTIHTKTKNIELTPFPNSNDEKYTILYNFLSDSNKQQSFRNVGPLQIVDIKKNKSITQIEASYTVFSNCKVSPEDILLKYKPNFYARKEGVDILIPIEKYKDISLLRNVASPIIIDGKKDFEYGEITLNSNYTKLSLGKSITLVWSEKEGKEKKTMELTYTPCNSLKNRIKDLHFLIQMIKNRKIRFQDFDFSLSFSKDDLQNIDIKSMQDDLQKLICLQDDLEALNIKDDLLLDGIDKSSWREFKLICDSVIRGKELIIEDKEDNFLSKKTFSNITLLLLCKKVCFDKSSYILHNLFKSNYIFQITLDNEEKTKHIVPPHSILSKEDYLEVSNIDYTEFVSSYKKTLKLNPRIYEVANQDLLELLNAYDESKGQKKELLNVAEELAEWILAEDKEISKEMNQVNYLQVIKRQRPLNDEENRILIKIIESPKVDKLLKVASYLLLDNIVSAKILFSDLNKNTQNAFMQYPIYTFWE